MHRALLLAAIILLPREAAAQERPQPLQELFFTEVVYPQSRHELQLTLGSLVDRARPDRAALVPFSIEYGLTDRWQIEAGWDGYTRFRTAPFRQLRTARMSLGTKYSLMNIAHSPVHAAAGIEVEFTRPGAFAEGEGEEGTEFEPFVAVAADLPGGVTLFASAGASVEKGEVVEVARGARPDDRGTISGGALLRVRRVTLAAEYTSRSDQAPWRLGGSPLVTPSLTLHPGHEWEFAVGVPIGVRSGTHRPGLAIHLVKEF